MGLKELAASTPGKISKSGPTCSVCRKLAELDKAEAKALRALLADPSWRFTTLADALAEQGHPLKAFILARHARGECSAGEKLR